MPSPARVGPGEAVRIFTGAPLPEGADRVVIQEDVHRDGDTITLGDRLGSETNIRPAGGDFRAGDRIAPPRRLRPADLGAAGGDEHRPQLPVTRRPVVALIATGDELVMPGEDPAPRPDHRLATASRLDGDGRGRGRRGADAADRPRHRGRAADWRSSWRPTPT